MANWKEPKNTYKAEDQVVPEIFNTLAENEKYLQEKKITTEQVQDAEVNSTQSGSRVSLGDKETVKGFFGKVRKWLADLKALAFKGTVGTADIDSSAITSVKIASGAVTTAKLSDKAVTDAKIDTVSSSKVTGLHKVATSGSYNDLKDKPTIPSGGSEGGGGLNFKTYDFYLYEQPDDIEEGIYLCFVVFTNRASISNVANLGLITYSPDCQNGSYSGISSIYDSGDEIKIQLHMNTGTGGKAKVGLISSQNGTECPNTDGYDNDGTFRVILTKLSDLGGIGVESGDNPSSGTIGGGSSSSGKALQFRKLKGADSKYNAFNLGNGSASYTISAPTNASNLIVLQGMLTCANKFWVTMYLRKTNPWSYATDTPVLFWLRSVNGSPGVSYGFISLEANISGSTLYVSGWKINQAENSYSNSHTRATNCYFALDSVYEILNSSE